MEFFMNVGKQQDKSSLYWHWGELFVITALKNKKSG
jgi:hypothetical protein